MKTVQDYYKKRFPNNELVRKDSLWRLLCESFLQKYVDKNSTVMDIGAGYCEFINNIHSRRKIAVDINPDVKKFANKDVQIVDSVSVKIPKSFDGKVDVVFMSNFLEHLSSKEEIIQTLERSNKVLRRGGRLIIMQPNINLIGNGYWDFIDHKMPLNVNSVIEALELAEFEVQEVIERFLPYTTKSIYSHFYFLTKLYLKIPSSFRPFTGQSFFVGAKK